MALATDYSRGMPHVEGAGVALHYEERGTGAPVLVVHAMGSDGVAWEPALGTLADAGGVRAIAYDRRGCGTRWRRATIVRGRGVEL